MTLVNKNILTTTLKRIWIIAAFILLVTPDSFSFSCLSGVVRDANGNPVANVDLDFIDTNGIKLVTPGDNTDVAGYYNVCILNSGIYRVTFGPPVGSNLLGRQYIDLDLTTHRSLDVVLEAGISISGQVSDSLGAPVGNVDINVDSIAGGRLFTPGDKTDPFTGAFWIVTPPGQYRIRFSPPVGNRNRGLQLDSVTIVGDTVLDLTLTPGVLLSGLVTDYQSAGVFGVDIDLRDNSTGAKIFVANNKTDTGGFYNVTVPPETVALRYSPLFGSSLVGHQHRGFAIVGDTTWDVQLQHGVTVAIHIHDSSGAPVVGADIDFKSAATGAKLFTPYDKTNPAGSTVVAVPANIYRIQLDPPIGSAFDQVILSNVSVAGDTTISVFMPEVVRMMLSGVVKEPGGLGIPGVEVDLRHPVTGVKAYVLDNVTGGSGAFGFQALVGAWDILFQPDRGSRYAGLIMDSISISVITSLGDVVLQQGVILFANVVDEFGTPLVGVDLDLDIESSLVEAFTPHDNTDSAGLAVVTVAPERYRVSFTLANGVTDSNWTTAGIDLVNDTTITFHLYNVPLDVDDDDSNNSGEPIDSYTLHQNYPNPFNGGTSINYVIRKAGVITLTIYNILGQNVQTLETGYRSVGAYQTSWEGTDQSGHPLASGVYFYRLETGDGAETRQMILVR